MNKNDFEINDFRIKMMQTNAGPTFTENWKKLQRKDILLALSLCNYDSLQIPVYVSDVPGCGMSHTLKLDGTLNIIVESSKARLGKKKNPNDYNYHEEEIEEYKDYNLSLFNKYGKEGKEEKEEVEEIKYGTMMEDVD